MRVALRVMTTLTYLASILLIVGLVYEHGFRISAAEAHQLQRLYHGVWIVFLADISLHIALEYKDTRRTFSRLTWILTFLLYLTLVPVVFHRPEVEGAVQAVWDFLDGRMYHLSLLLVLSFLNLSYGLVRLLGRRTNPSLILAVSFLIIILVGTGLLMLPRSTVSGISWVDSLFISTSAVCVTGLTSVDVASTFQNFAKYLVASEEVEPGNGWLYSGWLGALAENTDMDGAALGTAICDTYYQGCEAVGTQDQTTLSMTDLSKLNPLLEAYESFGQEALAAAAEDPGFFAELGRAAARSENYGGNTREQGYTNMVDLGHLARQTAWMLPSAQRVCDALTDCVIYQVGGPYRAEATGLSCYYSYNGDVDDLNGYITVGESTAFKHLYAYELTGELAEDGEEYLSSLDIGELPERVTLADMDWDGAPLDLDDEGTSFLTLGPEANDVLAGIGFSLFYVDEAGDQMLLLGTDNDLTADWENGVFYDNFRGVWGALDGHLVYMELSFEGEDYNLYSVPILLNGEAYNLQVAYDFTAEEWSILGASQGLDESGMASKELRLLAEGDVITTIWKAATFTGDDDFEMYAAEELTVTAGTAFGEAPLFDGSYSMVFEMWDAAGNYACSDAVTFDCAGGEISTTVYED